MTKCARKTNEFRDRYMYQLLEKIWRGKRTKRRDVGETNRMTEANSAHFVARHVGVAHEVAMTSQLKRIPKCMLTTAYRQDLCRGSWVSGANNRRRSSVGTVRDATLPCRPAGRTINSINMNAVVFSLPSCRTAHAANEIGPGNLGS
jgi:hypothetical protein